MTHKAGFVNIIGRPNVGKSTLMNSLVGEKLSIITNKAQTTRHRILGILSSEDYQVVFSDTPGILEPNYKLQEFMMREVEGSLTDADIFLYVTEIGERRPDERIVKRIIEANVPIVLVINKIDASTQEKVVGDIEFWKGIFPEAVIVPASAKEGFNKERVLEEILANLPESPAYYDKEDLTDRHMRFIVAEIIREKILLTYDKEVPYSTEVVIDNYLEEPKLLRISVIIYCSRESQKPILIGEGGRMLKKVGTHARKDIEEFTGRKVFLEMNVKVAKDWRDDPRLLKHFGYNND
ncbi:MAG TPA: GTPase Era [Bacteroidales bacterium]|nr:MAG: GTPase Era [Bacteroidetes bacterium GWE2_42_24]OFY25267.1 MAG: GTPase Era [Bacteroidetes bacterium GWF2_43_11]HBZ66972.1 GTPase Era [Bacteroidales bacterium]